MKDISPMEGISPAALVALLKGDVNNFLIASTPGGIENQEAQGQQDLINAEIPNLPKRILDWMSLGENVEEIYGLIGVEILGDSNDIFLNVKLPLGWRIEATDHSMWSKLLDADGNDRAAIFYKAAFYDRDCHISFNNRFYIKVEPEDAYKSNVSYKEREKMKVYGRVYDKGLVVFQTEGKDPILVTRETIDVEAARDRELRIECENWLINKGYTEYKNPFKCW